METKTFTDFGALAERVLKEEIKLGRITEDDPHHQLMQIAQAIGNVVTTTPMPVMGGGKVNYSHFNKLCSFDEAYRDAVAPYTEHQMAYLLIEILCVIAERGIEIGGLDNFTLNNNPACFMKGSEGMSLNEFLYELLGTLMHRSTEEASTLEIIKLWEQNPADKELEEAINEQFGEVEEPEDIDIRTSYGYENYILQMRLMAMLNAIGSWFKSRGGKGMVWHINALLYIRGEEREYHG